MLSWFPWKPCPISDTDNEQNMNPFSDQNNFKTTPFGTAQCYFVHIGGRRRQRGFVVSASDSLSGVSRFESRSSNFLDSFSVVPSSNPSGHDCKLPASCPLPVGVFHPVTSYLNYLFLIIWVECLKTSWINNLLTIVNLQSYREQPPLGKYTYHHNQFPCIQVRTCIHIHLWLHYKLLRFGMDLDCNDALPQGRICVR